MGKVFLEKVIPRKSFQEGCNLAQVRVVKEGGHNFKIIQCPIMVDKIVLFFMLGCIRISYCKCLV